MIDLTYPYLVEFHKRAVVHLSPGTQEWVESKARAAAGGKAYPANLPLPEDHVEEGVGDPQTYAKVYNACIHLLGKHLADSVARQVVGTEQTTEPAEQALEEWARATEIYGKGGKEPPDYVPADKRAAWSAIWDDVYVKSKSEKRAFMAANGWLKKQS